MARRNNQDRRPLGLLNSPHCFYPWSLAVTLLILLGANLPYHRNIEALDLSNGGRTCVDGVMMNRRSAMATTASLWPLTSQTQPSRAVMTRTPKDTMSNAGNLLWTDKNSNGSLQIVTDPNTYTALAYSPPKARTIINGTRPPLIVVLHGAGRNDQGIRQDLADPMGEHAGLIPSLLASAESEMTSSAPITLLEKFSVLAPYSYGKSSFYNDPRRQLLNFVEWAIENQNTEILPIQFDPNRIVLFGFSDGATVAIELLTSQQITFKAGIICSYGYTGKSLPPLALERLANIPIWVFHSQDDVIFDVRNSDRLVKQLRYVNGEQDDPNRDDPTNMAKSSGSLEYDPDRLIRYSRYSTDPEHLPARVRGHSMGITASKSVQVYDWLLMKLPLRSEP